MGYTPTEWKTGDVVTSEKLNNIESGIEDAETFFVTFTPKEGSSEESIEVECDKTSSEIWDAFSSGKQVIGLSYNNQNGENMYMLIPMTSIMNYQNNYFIVFESVNIIKGSSMLTDVLIEITHFNTDDSINFSYYNYQLTPIQN